MYTYGIFVIGHSVERTNSKGKLVEDIIVGFVFFFHKLAEELFLIGAMGRNEVSSTSVYLDDRVKKSRTRDLRSHRSEPRFLVEG